MNRYLVTALIGFGLSAPFVNAQTGTVPLDSGTAPSGLTNSNITVSNGNVGIGTTTSPTSLSVQGVSWATQAPIATFTNGTNGAYTSLSSAGSSSVVPTWNNGAQILEFVPYSSGNGIISTYTGNLLFQTNSRTTQMSVLSNGNVGIGTTTPGAKLEVNGNVTLTAGSNASITYPDGTVQTTAYVNNGVITASDPTYGSINVKMNGASIPVITYTRWAGSGSIQDNAYAGLFLNTSDGSYDYGIGTGISTTGNQTAATNIVTVTQAGTVGIGTTSPGAKLEVNGNVKLTSGSGASITFPDGTVQSTAWSGTLCGGDYAESVNASGDHTNYEPGDVLVISDADSADVTKSTQPYSTLVAGIYSTKPGMVGRRQTVAKSDQEIPMAMVGIVPAKVSAENGPIRKGDLLVTASIPGYAMKGTDPTRMLGAIVGKALGSLNSGTGVIEVLVSLQ